MFAIGSHPAKLADRLRSGAGLALPVAMLACAALTAPAVVLPAVAQQVPKAAAPNGLKAFESGAKAFETGKTDQAIQSLSTALSQGGLSSQQMAKALYYRGVAYRKQGKAAQAISDLTSSVWLKNGLSDSERAAAMDQRQGAYRDAGLGDNPVPIGAAPLDGPADAQAPAAVTVAAPPSAPVPPAAATVAWSPPDESTAAAGPVAASDSATSSWAVATSAQSAAQASVPNLSSPFAVTSGSPDAPVLAALPPDGATSPASAPSLGGVGSAIGNTGSAVGNFFSGLFSGSSGSTATPQPSAALATSATGSAEQAAGSAAASPSSSDWNSSTSIVTAAVQPSAPPASSRATPLSATALGNFNLQVGVVRSRQDAERMAEVVRQKHAERLGAAAATIDEVVYGNMGTFYRVRIGPYADGGVPGQVCASLKPEGYDCMVVTR